MRGHRAGAALDYVVRTRVHMGVPSSLCDDGVPRTWRPALPLSWASGLRFDDPFQRADGVRLD